MAFDQSTSPPRRAGSGAFASAGPSASPCNLCPRLCGALRDAGQRGACGAGSAMVVARAALHFWEEPPVSGESGSGTVFFSGCPVHCAYCQNAAIAAGEVGREVSVERLAQICLELEGKGALNVNFVTPTHHSLQIARAVACARQRGFSLPVVWNTSGYERVETVWALSGMVDVYLADFKYADPQLAERYSHARDYPEVALAAIEAMLAQVGSPRFDEFGPHAVETTPGESDAGVSAGPADGPCPRAADVPQRRMTRGVIVRHLLLPGSLEGSERALAMLYERFGNKVLYSIMNQYTPVLSGAKLERFPELGARVSPEDYEQLLDYADDLGIRDYFWQDGPAAEESFIPAWDCEGV